MNMNVRMSLSVIYSICLFVLLSTPIYAGWINDTDPEDILGKYMPFEEGRKWQYKVYINGKSLELQVVNLKFTVVNGKTVVPRQVNNGELLAFDLYRSDGVGTYAKQTLSDIEPKVVESFSYGLKLPIQEGTTWTASTRLFLATAFGEDENAELKNMIDSTDETVITPSGTFEHCIRIKGTGSKTIDYAGETTISVEDYSWYAKDVDLVKSIRKETAKNKQSFKFIDVDKSMTLNMQLIKYE